MIYSKKSVGHKKIVRQTACKSTKKIGHCNLNLPGYHLLAARYSISFLSSHGENFALHQECLGERTRQWILSLHSFGVPLDCKDKRLATPVG